MFEASAHVLPGMDEDSLVEHRLDVGSEFILSFEVAFVHWATVHEHAVQTDANTSG